MNVKILLAVDGSRYSEAAVGLVKALKIGSNVGQGLIL